MINEGDKFVKRQNIILLCSLNQEFIQTASDQADQRECVEILNS